MRATSTRTGTRRRGTVDVTVDGATYVYAYTRTREHGVEMIGLCQIGDVRAPRQLSGATCEIASNAVEALNDGPLTWTVEREIDGWTVTAGAEERAA